MNIFISWSGAQSRALAEALKDYLPLVIQAATPWFSAEDIDKGARWLPELGAQLAKQSVGIVCVTPDSVRSPWLLFEAGALSKALDASRVCPVLLGVEPAEVTGPLAQFQFTRTTRADIRALLATINKRIEPPLSDRQIDTVHERLWPDLEEKFKSAAAIRGTAPPPARSQIEVLSEVLDRVRALERHWVESKKEGPTKRATVATMVSLPLLERLAHLQNKLTETLAGIKGIDAAIPLISPEQPEETARLQAKRQVLRGRADSLIAETQQLEVKLERRI